MRRVSQAPANQQDLAELVSGPGIEAGASSPERAFCPQTGTRKKKAVLWVCVRWGRLVNQNPPAGLAVTQRAL